MGRTYKRKTDEIDVQVLQLAVLDIKNGKSFRETARKFNIPLRHKRANDNVAGIETSSVSTETSIETASPFMISDIQIRGIDRLTMFDKEQEKSLEEYLLYCSDIFFDMTSKDTHSLAYQFAN